MVTISASGFGTEVAVTVFAGNFGIGRDARDFLQPVSRHFRCMVAGAAGEEGHCVDLAQHLGGIEAEPFGLDVILRHGNQQRVGQRARLFVDFLLHEVAVVAELGHVGRQLGNMHAAVGWLAGRVVHLHGQQADIGDIAFFQIHHALRDRQQGGHVGGDEIFLDAETDQQRAALAGADQSIGRVLAHHADGVGAFEFGHRRAGGGEQVLALAGNSVRSGGR